MALRKTVLKVLSTRTQRALAPLKRFNSNEASECQTKGLLEGIRILDLTRILAGPYCTMILGDMGAEVIKVENPDKGDETRQWGPPFVKDQSCYFLSINRNKKSIGVDLKHPKGREIILELASKSDVLVENFVPGKVEELGLGHNVLCQMNPRLIYCSISGFGQDGPYQKRSGFDVIAASIGGLLHITGPEDGQPCKIGVAMTDLATGLYAHGAILAALLQRKSTGYGQVIGCDLLSTQVALLVNLASNYLNAGIEPRRWGTAHESIVPYQAFRTSDGYITVAAGSDKQFREICTLLDLHHLGEDPNFASNQDRVAHRGELLTELEPRFRQKTTSQWLDIFQNSTFPYGPINKLSEVYGDPQVLHNRMVRDMDHSTVGPVKVTGPAVRFSGGCNEPRLPPPALGEYTDQVLTELVGLTASDIQELRKSRIVY